MTPETGHSLPAITLVLAVLSIFTGVECETSTSTLANDTAPETCVGVKGTPRQPTKLSNGIDVLCDTVTDGGGWIVFQKRSSGSLDFHRTWKDYKEGFADNDHSNCWLGNDNLHKLTANRTYEMLVEMEHEGKRYWARYLKFSIDSAKDKYRLHLGPFYGNVSDQLSYHNGMMFTTKDQDNDEMDDDCSKLLHGGWWFKDCKRANLNGDWGGSRVSGITWKNIANNNSEVSFVEMKIRPKKMIRSCKDAKGKGQQVALLENGMGVVCDTETDGGGWTVFQRRNDSSVDFYRSWEEYRDGFGNLEGNFWLGNENIHKLVKNSSTQLKIEVSDGNNTYVANYDFFSIADEKRKYRLSVGNHTGNLSDSLRAHHGMSFTTKNSDNDNSEKHNCAILSKGGWWYRDCLQADLNGKMGNEVLGMFWRSIKAKNASVVSSEMKFRHVVDSCEEVKGADRQNAFLKSGFELLCDTKTEGGGWLVFQRRTGPGVDFNKTWEEYKKGFGDVRKDNFWLGTEYLHSLTSNGVYELRVDMVYGGKEYFAKYPYFSVESEEKNYRMVLHGFGSLDEGNYPEDFRYHSGMAFTTTDKDHDAMGQLNCARLTGSAWWFRDCHKMNLNGQWGSAEYSSGPQSFEVTGYNRSLVLTEMKIRKHKENCSMAEKKPRQPMILTNGMIVLCDTVTEGGKWIVIQRRVDGDTNFNRTWQDYKEGFGNLDNGSFWLGNEKIHQLTSSKQKFELRIDMAYKGKTYYAKYTSFEIDGEENDYKLKSLGNYTGTAGDSLSYHKSGRFSTFDHDKDALDNINCAQYNGGGWWMKYCQDSNLNGLWNCTKEDQGVQWTTVTRSFNSLTFAEMKIRPVGGET